MSDSIQNGPNPRSFIPSLAIKSMPSTFCVSADLREPVDPELLQEAVSLLAARYPFIRVREGQTLFSSVLRYDDHIPQARRVVQKGHMVKWRNLPFPLMVVYDTKYIGIAASSSLTDGHGVLTMLKTLLLAYLRLAGHAVPESGLVREPGSSILPSETEDAFRACYHEDIPTTKLTGRAFHTDGRPLEANRLGRITGVIPTETLKETTKKYQVTVTEYLGAVYLYALYRIQQRESNRETPIRLSIPVDLRGFYETETLRNFSLFIRPEIHTGLGEYDLPELIRHVCHSLRYARQKKQISSTIRTNFTRHLRLQNGLHRLGRFEQGELYHSGTLSNMRQVEIPDEMAGLITGFDFTLGPNSINHENCGIIGYDGVIRITFTRTVQDPSVSREFFRILSEEGITAEIL